MDVSIDFQNGKMRKCTLNGDPVSLRTAQIYLKERAKEAISKAHLRADWARRSQHLPQPLLERVKVLEAENRELKRVSADLQSWIGTNNSKIEEQNAEIRRLQQALRQAPAISQLVMQMPTHSSFTRHPLGWRYISPNGQQTQSYNSLAGALEAGGIKVE